MEEALFLSRFATKVTIIHRREHFRASKIMLDRARKHEKIEFLTDTMVEDVLDPSLKEVVALKLKNVKTGKVWDFPTSAMFLGIGHEPNAKMFTGQLDMDDDGYLKTHDFVMTRVPGVFAFSDVQNRRRYRARRDYRSGIWLRCRNGSGEVSGRARKLSSRPPNFYCYLQISMRCNHFHW